MFFEFEVYICGVIVYDRYMVVSSVNMEIFLFYKCFIFGIDIIEDFMCFGFKFVFFVIDERNDVVDDIYVGYIGVVSIGDSLYGDNVDGGDGVESCLESGEGDDEINNGVVGVVDEEVFFEVVDGVLVGDEREVRKVDCRDDEGNEWIMVVVFCVGEDRDFSFDEFYFCNFKLVKFYRVCELRVINLLIFFVMLEFSLLKMIL